MSPLYFQDDLSACFNVFARLPSQNLLSSKKASHAKFTFDSRNEGPGQLKRERLNYRSARKKDSRYSVY